MNWIHDTYRGRWSIAVTIVCLLALATPPAARFVDRSGGVIRVDVQRRLSRAPSPVVIRTVAAGGIGSQFLHDDSARRVFVLTPLYSGERATFVVDALDARTGVRLRTVMVRSPSTPTAFAVDPTNGRLFVTLSATTLANGIPGPSTRLDIFDGRTLSVLASRPFGPAIVTGMVADGSLKRLYVYAHAPLNAHNQPTGPATVRVLDLATGAPRQTIPLDDNVGSMAIDSRTERLFVGDQVLDARTGATIATIPAASVGDYTVDEAVGRVISTGFPGSTTSSFTILDAMTGAVLQTGAVCADGGLALDATAGRVACLGISRSSSGDSIELPILDVRTGRLLHDVDLGMGIAVAGDLGVDERTSRAIVVQASASPAEASISTGFGRSAVAVVDLRSGRVTSNFSLELGTGPPAIVVDNATQRVFVANPGDTTVSVLDATRL